MYTDKQGREFENKEEHEKFLRQADAVGQWEEKRRVPERGRLTWFYPDFGVHVPNDWVSRNEVAEKFNEITGRQMPMEPDPLVELRSAVHSNYAGMVAMLGADNRVYLGKTENYQHNYDQPDYYDNRDGSMCFVTDQPDMYYFLYGEGWAKSQEAMLEHGLTMEQYVEFARLRDGVLRQFEPRRELLFAGRPFQPPENYLRSAELTLEGQRGNYNQIDGLVNNEPPARADLTDGQTHEEIRELAPHTLPEERPSLVEQLKAGQPEHEARMAAPSLPEREL